MEPGDLIHTEGENGCGECGATWRVNAIKHVATIEHRAACTYIFSMKTLHV